MKDFFEFIKIFVIDEGMMEEHAFEETMMVVFCDDRTIDLFDTEVC